MKEQVSTKRYYLFYTAVFLFVDLCIFAQFIYYGKTMIESYDALYQYYASFEYFSDYMRGILKSIFTAGKLEIPLWDFTIGMGGDVITSLNYYVIGDPLNLIGVFFKHKQLETVFQMLILVRLYLAGLAFSAFCRKLGYKSYQTAIGALIYSFSMFSLYSACMYAAFLNVLIYLPLLLIGIEKVFRRESGKVLIFSTALCLISNFYFSYMLAIFAVIYCIVRYCVINVSELRKEKKTASGQIAKDFILHVMRIFVPVCAGVLLSCVILIPTVYVFLNQGRGAGQVVENYWLYPVKRYVELIGSMFAPKIAADYNLMGYCPVTFLSILLIWGASSFRKDREKRVVRILFLVSALFLLIPVFGYAMNGFAYLNSRWIFGLAFLMAFSVVTVFQKLLELNHGEKMLLLIGTAIYFVVYVLFNDMHTLESAMGSIWMAIFLIVVFALNMTEISKEMKKWVLMGTCIICIGYYGFSFYSPQNTTILQTKINTKETQNIAKRTSAGAVSRIHDDDTFYRVDVKDWTTLNEALLLKYPSVAFYYSLYDGKITEFNKELENSMLSVPNLSHGNGGRTYLNLLTNVKYLIMYRKEPEPYGYEHYDTYKLKDETKRKVYINKEKLPFGYTVEEYFPRSEYLQLSPLQKEQVMLQGIVLEKNENGMKELEPTYSDGSLAYEVVKTEEEEGTEATEGITITGNKIYVTQKNAALTLRVDIPENSELFVRGSGIRFQAYSPLEHPEYYDGDVTAGKYDKRLWEKRYKNWEPASRVIVKAKLDKVSQSIPMYQKNYKYYWNQDSFLLSLGSGYSGSQEIQLSFSEIGEYEFSRLEVLTEDLTVIPQQVEKARTESLENVAVSTNKIQGNITTQGHKMLLLSVPYSTGWSVKVDGQPQDLVCANTMWSAVWLENAGEHEVVLTYQTPGLKIGWYISLSTFICVAGYYIVVRYQKRKQKKTAKN